MELGRGSARMFLEHLIKILATDAAMVGNGIDTPVTMLNNQSLGLIDAQGGYPL